MRLFRAGVLGDAIAAAERTEEHGTIDRITCTEAAQRLYTSTLFQFDEQPLPADATPNDAAGGGAALHRGPMSRERLFGVAQPTDVSPI